VEHTLRDFRQSDFNSLWRIDQQCFPPGIAYSRFELAAYIQRRKSFTIVAETGPLNRRKSDPLSPPPHELQIIGFIVTETKANVGHVISIDVLPPARRAGIGSKLLQAAELRLLERNCQTVVLETAVDNHSALSFYKRHGYYVVNTIPRYYSNGVDALVLQKDLRPAAEDVPAVLNTAR